MAYISLPAIRRPERGAGTFRLNGGKRKTKESRRGETGGGVAHGLSNNSGVEDVGDGYGAPALSLIGVPYERGVAGGVLRESRSIRVLSRVQTSTSRSWSITGECTP